MSGSKGLIDKKVTELVSEIYNRVDGRGVLAGSALAEALEIADAALRRAKAEGMRAAIDGATSLKASVANGIPPHERVGFVRACNELIGYAKARAAQIEEGE